jgi:pyrimidine operon attenuation protein / uracil phosphoribosyltransferase
MLTTRGRIKVRILDAVTIQQALSRIAQQILDRNPDLDQVEMVGIGARGEMLAKRLAGILKSTEGKIVSASLLVDSSDDKQLNNISHKTIILVNDVLYTGRHALQAIASLLNQQNVESVQLAVLVDRGNRELPIHADYVGKNVPTATDEYVQVRLKELDKEEQVLLMENR